jgi:hypothetical protein
MTDLKDVVEATYSRTPLLRIPDKVYYIQNAHWHVDVPSGISSLRRTGSIEGGHGVLGGWHRLGSNYVVVADTNDDMSETLLHETLHMNGMVRERGAHLLDSFMKLRTQRNIGILRRDVQYEYADVTDEERAELMGDLHEATAGMEMGLHVREGRDVNIVKLVRKR